MTHQPQTRPQRAGAVARVCSVPSHNLGPLERAGHTLRTRGEAAVPEVLAALAALDPTEVGRDVCACTGAALRRRVEEAAGEAFEATFSEGGDGKTLDPAWASEAMQALDLRDGLQSMDTALQRMSAMTGGSNPALAQARAHLAELVVETDVVLRAELRSFLALGPMRRARGAELVPDEQARAYWYAERADCDDLLRLLAGADPSGGEHARRCPDCQGDLRRTEEPLAAAHGARRVP